MLQTFGHLYEALQTYMLCHRIVIIGVYKYAVPPPLTHTLPNGRRDFSVRECPVSRGRAIENNIIYYIVVGDCALRVPTYIMGTTSTLVARVYYVITTLQA